MFWTGGGGRSLQWTVCLAEMVYETLAHRDLLSRGRYRRWPILIYRSRMKPVEGAGANSMSEPLVGSTTAGRSKLKTLPYSGVRTITP